MFAHDAEARNVPASTDELFAFARLAAQQGIPAHEVEEGLWTRLLALGRQAMGQFFHVRETGDLGPELSQPDGSPARRLPELHERPDRSVFGDFTLAQTCYGSREGQAITVVPLDARLQLPEPDYSYLLPRWDAGLGSEFAPSRPTPAARPPCRAGTGEREAREEGTHEGYPDEAVLVGAPLVGALFQPSPA